jgi:succinate-semialdehyde dehydrogenase/glutarate-semialdehyde dehydrogenase
MPWNFPFWQVIRFAAPALVAGNVAVLKHATNVPQCALAIESVLAQAGFPQGVFQVVLLPAARVEPIIADERVAAVTLTGSERAGSEVASAAGRHLKKSVLELGGSDPFVVLPSADIRLAARMAATARTVNSGQSCIAAKRFIVVESIARDFQAAFVDAMRSLRTGDPTRDDTQVGPLATAQVLHDVERQVGAARAAGARVALGGERPRGKGFFFPPTVLLDVDPGSPVCTEEVFGPVAPVLVARDVGHALTLANTSRYGLGASVWTTDRREMEMFTRELESGMVFVNAVVHSDARLPFGGVKRSGYGRELGKTGMREFVNVKTIRVREEPAAG